MLIKQGEIDKAKILLQSFASSLAQREKERIERKNRFIEIMQKPDKEKISEIEQEFTRFRLENPPEEDQPDYDELDANLENIRAGIKAESDNRSNFYMRMDKLKIKLKSKSMKDAREMLQRYKERKHKRDKESKDNPKNI